MSSSPDATARTPLRLVLSRRLALVALSVLVAGGAVADDMTPVAAGMTASPGVLAPLTRDDTVGGAQACRRFVEAIEQGDGDKLLSVVDGDSLTARIAEGLPFTESERVEFEQGMKVMLGNVARLIATSTPEGFDASYRGLLVRGGRVHGLVRLDMGELGINYFELSLGRSADGGVWVDDWYDYAQASLYSVSVRQLGALASGDPDVMATAAGVRGADPEGAKQTAVFVAHVHAGQLAKALEVWYTLPEPIRHARPMLLQRIRLASMLGDEQEHRRALADLATYWGHDPRLALSLVDHYFYTGQREELFGALDAMTRYMGVRDTGLVHLEGAYHELLGNHAEAERLAREAIAGEPTYEASHWVLVQALLGQGRFDEVTPALRAIEQTFGYEIDPAQIAAQPMYAEYARSESFRRWQEEGATPAARK